MPAPLGVGGQQPGFPQFDELVVDAGLRQAAGFPQRPSVPTLERIDQHCLAQQSVQCTLLVFDTRPFCFAPDQPHRVEQPGQQDIGVLTARWHR